MRERRVRGEFVFLAPPQTTLLLGLVTAWLVLGLAGLVRSQRIGWVAYTLFPIGALVALGIAALGFSALTTSFVVERVVLPLGLPDLPFHVRLDALSGFFLLLLGVAGVGISVFAAGYFRGGGRYLTGFALPAVPHVSGEHGDRDPGRRRLPVHGGMGDDGGQLVLPGNHAAPHSGDPARRLSVPADRARGGHWHCCCASAYCTVAAG